MKVIVTKTLENGNIDVEDLREKAIAHKDDLSCLMVTYPSTHGVFESAIKEITQMAFDGETSWSTNFMTMKAEKDDSENTENVKRAAGDFISPLIDYKGKGYSLELLPNETIEGVECFKIKLTKKTMLSEEKEIPNVEYYYFDKENYVPIVVEQEISSGEMKGQISQTLYSDYQEVNGIYFAFSMTQKIKDGMGQTIVFESVELNKEFESSMFKFPGE